MISFSNYDVEKLRNRDINILHNSKENIDRLAKELRAYANTVQVKKCSYLKHGSIYILPDKDDRVITYTVKPNIKRIDRTQPFTMINRSHIIDFKPVTCSLNIDSYTRVVAGVMITKDERLLLLFHNKLGKYSLPIGKIEKNESDVEALHREMKEELNINVDKEKFLFSYDLHEYKSNVGVYLIHSSDLPINNEPDKHQELYIKNIDNILVGKVTHTVGKFIEYYINELKRNIPDEFINDLL